MTTLKGRYEILRRFEGGMGVVLVCRDLQSPAGKLVALKTYLDGTPSLVKQRFVQEAQVWIRLQAGAYLMGLENIEIIDERPFLVMRYCARGSLADRRLPLSRGEYLRIGAQLLLALERVCDRECLVHRDLKPGNILFDDEDDVALSDLGLVKAFGLPDPIAHGAPEDMSLTQAGSFLGSLPYAPPEQILGEADLDMRADVWAFGAVIYEMALGAPPFIGPTPKNLARQILEAQPSRWKEFASSVGKPLAAIVERCLRKDRRQRYSSFLEICRDWDELIRLPGVAVKEGWLSTNARTFIDDPRLGQGWEYLLGGKRPQVTVDLSIPQNLKRVAELRKLGRYEEALRLCQDTLGDPRDSDSRLWRSVGAPLKETSKGRYELNSDAVILQMTNLALALYVDVAEASATPDAMHIKEFAEFADALLERGYGDFTTQRLCAQALVKASRFEDCERLSRHLLSKSNDPGVWWVLLVAIRRQGNDKQLREFIANELVPALTDQQTALAQATCAKACAILESWDMSANYSERAYALNPNNHKYLYEACCALINGGWREDAMAYYEKLRVLVPQSKSVAHLREILERHQSSAP